MGNLSSNSGKSQRGEFFRKRRLRHEISSGGQRPADDLRRGEMLWGKARSIGGLEGVAWLLRIPAAQTPTRGSLALTGNIVTRSLFPLPSRTSGQRNLPCCAVHTRRRKFLESAAYSDDHDARRRWPSFRIRRSLAQTPMATIA